ncbi:MAG: hypothetical protein HZC54_01710 [Verrucomicrobia bacterium]|nr:hypothetical protein [Verrucomicrobiota bacterium]
MRHDCVSGRFYYGLMFAAMLAVASVCLAESPGKDQFPWLDNTLGMEREVPAPWTPVTVDGQTFGVWGRTIEFKDSFLPVQITSQKVPLLAAPMRLEIMANGKPLAFHNVKTTVLSKREDQVVLESTGSVPGLKCTTTTTIEFDGMIKINVLLTPEAPVGIASYRIIIPVSNEVAKVLARFLEYDFVQMRTNKMDISNAVKELDGKPVEVEFMPEVSLVNRKVGLTWNAETNAQWDYADPKKALAIIPGKGSTDLVMNVVDHPVTLDKTKTVEFALFPTPLKPFDPRLRQMRLAAGGRFLSAFKAGASRDTYDHYAIHFPGDFAQLYDSLPVFDPNNAAYRRCREADKRERLKFIPYGALWYSNAVHPAPRKFYEQWYLEPAGRSAPARWKKYDAGETQDLLKQQNMHWDGYRVCAWPKSYADFLVYYYCEAVEKEKIDGIYFDHGEVVISCRNTNHKHIVEPTGKQPHLYFGVFANRELLKRLWIATKKINPDLIITQHQSHTSKGLNSFMDIVVTGEILNCIFAGSPSAAAVQKNPASYVPDYDKVPRALMDYDCLESCGFDSRLLPQIKYLIEDYWKEHPAEFKFYSDKMYRYALLNGFRMYDGAMEQKSINDAWIALDKMGRWTPEMVFHGWWDNEKDQTVKAAHPTTKISYYARPGKVLLILANEGKKDVEEVVTLNLPGKFAKATDAVTGQTVPLEGSVVKVKLPAELYRAVLLTP